MVSAVVREIAKDLDSVLTWPPESDREPKYGYTRHISDVFPFICPTWTHRVPDQVRLTTGRHPEQGFDDVSGPDGASGAPGLVPKLPHAALRVLVGGHSQHGVAQ